MNGNVIFLAPGGHDDEETRRTVRARAAEYSHRYGNRKPKASKNPNARKRKAKHAEPPSEPQSRRSSVMSIASSSSSAPPVPEINSVLVDSRPKTPLMRGIGNQKEDSFQRYPVDPQPWFGRLIDYMWPFMLRGWTALDTTQVQRQEAMVWVQRLTMSSPCYFYMNMLSVSGDLVGKGSLDHQMLPWHSSQVVRSINEALQDPEKALNVGTILAVGRIALHEILVGDITVGNQFHRPAWARMIAMAGGLDALGLPALVRAHVGWANRLMTLKTGMLLSGFEPTLMEEPTFNLDRRVSEDVAVLDQYIPARETVMAMNATQGRNTTESTINS